MDPLLTAYLITLGINFLLSSVYVVRNYELTTKHLIITGIISCIPGINILWALITASAILRDVKEELK